MFRILVVEDDIKLNKLFCTVLKRNNYHTISALDGVEALELLKTQYVDLIVSDIMMPNLNGYELTKALRDAEYNLPVLMITVKENFEDKQKGFLVERHLLFWKVLALFHTNYCIKYGLNTRRYSLLLNNVNVIQIVIMVFKYIYC